MAKNLTAKTDKSSPLLHKRQGIHSKQQLNTNQAEQPPLTALQNQIGNRTVQRLLAQRTDTAPAELNDTTADRINRARGGGQTLDTTIQQKMGEAMGSDFGGVRVHTDSESHALNEQLGAKAFTTGRDVFFRDGEYNPHSSDGQELIAHELTHVVQQGSGAVSSGGSRMQVNAPGDQFEQEADAVAHSVTAADAAPAVQRQELPEEEEPEAAQRQELEEDEEAPDVMGKFDVQRQEAEEMPEEDMAAESDEMLPEEEMT